MNNVPDHSLVFRDAVFRVFPCGDLITQGGSVPILLKNNVVLTRKIWR